MSNSIDVTHVVAVKRIHACSYSVTRNQRTPVDDIPLVGTRQFLSFVDGLRSDQVLVGYIQHWHRTAMLSGKATNVPVQERQSRATCAVKWFTSSL